MMRFSVRSSMHVALLVVAGLLCISHSEAHAMLPLYAQDATTQIVDWGPTPTPRESKLAELIQKCAVVYAENGSFDNDAPYFAHEGLLWQNPHALMHYVFYGNLRYEGSPYWVDPERHANKYESNFYHATDPASLTAWFVNDGIVRLHWTPDLRFLTSAEMLGMFDPNNHIPNYQIPDAMRVVRFIITRHEPGGDVELPARVVPWDGRMDYDKDLFACDDSTGSAAVSYSIKSVKPGDADSEALEFGALLTAIRPAAEPHFWAVKRNYQEPYYAAADDSVLGATLPVNWSLSFFVDRELPEATPNLDIRRLLKATRNESGDEDTTSISLTTDFNYDRVTGEISCSIRTQAPDFETPSESDWYVRGGVAYQLVYTPPTGPVVVYPEPATFDGVTRSRFMWTSINNRTMGCGWPNYLMNCEGDDWIITVKEMCNRLGTAITPPLATESVVYNRLLFDVVMGVISGHHNLIRPFELATDAQCRAANVTNMESICADFATKGAGFGIVCNTADLAFVDACENGDQPKPGFSGVMDENFTNRKEGERALADLLWKFRGHQFAHNLFKNRGNFQNALGDRMQAAAAFLMAREPEYVSDREPRATFGYGEWDTPPPNESALVPIFPEQFISALRPSLSDPFAATVWPAYSSGPSPWQTEVTSDSTAVVWLKSHAPGFVYSVGGVRDFAVSRWELDDGLPGVFNEVIEPPRDCRRLHSLRGWGHEQEESVLPRGPRTSSSDGPRPPKRIPLAVAGREVAGFEVRLLS